MESIIKDERPIDKKPIVSYYKSGNPCLNFDWVKKLTEINIIQTKTLSDDFIKICLEHKNKIFLHVVISGMGKTIFEPNIDTVKVTFNQLSKLINMGFPVKQILVVVKPILSNDNGLKALELLLRVFTEYRILRLRFVRFNLLTYKTVEDNNNENEHIIKKSASKQKFVIGNENILQRQSTKSIMKYLNKNVTFYKDYYKLIKKYSPIISIDSNDEATIGVRELMCFGYNNSWTNPDGTKEKIITYTNNSRFKPVLNIISNPKKIRCAMRCLLCEHKY